MESEWCHGCQVEWASWQVYHRGPAPAQRLSYEIHVEVSCDEPLQLSPEPRPLVHQLVMPWDESQAPAEPEVLEAALRRQLAGCAFSLDQISEPSPN